MSLKGLLTILHGHPGFRRHLNEVDNPDKLPQIAVRQGARACYIGALWSHVGVPVLVITPRPEDARRLHDQLLTYVGEAAPAYLLPEPEVLPFERLVVDANTSNQRLVALAALACVSSQSRQVGISGHAPVPSPLAITSIAAVLRKTLPPAIFSSAVGGPTGGGSGVSDRLRVGQRVRLSQLLPRWVELGYRNEPIVESRGAFSQRGGIIDVYPPQAEVPFRIELLDDEIETIRLFDPYSQRSVRTVDEVCVIPAREQLPKLADEARVAQLLAQMDFTDCHVDTRERMEEELATLIAAPNLETLSFYNGLLNPDSSGLDYLPADGLLVLDRLGQMEAEAQEMYDRFAQMRASREDRGELPRHFPSPHLDWGQFAAELLLRRRVLLQPPYIPPSPGQSEGGTDADRIFQPATPYYGKLEQFASDVRRHQQEGKTIVAVSQHARRLAEILAGEGMGVSVSANLDEMPQPGGVYLLAGSLREGWALASPPSTLSIGDGKGVAEPEVRPAPQHLTLLTDAELFGTAKERRYRRPRTNRGSEVVLSELVPGNYVVHIDHGVARFAGTTRMDDPSAIPPDEGGIQGSKEYLVLEYADNDKLYVPTEHLDRVSAYVAAQDQPPTLSRLGTAEWAKTKERVKGATRELAEELLKLYASRQVAEGHEFSPDTVWQQELEDSFPYDETPDQSQAINEVKADMEQSRPMDRLICGDVGYGKTEVALRAAFKTVADGMQVGLLVPTTVLAQQHYGTFSERLSPFPLRVEVLSRFRTPKEQQEVVEGLKQGTVDIVIGTHRLLQKDVHFKNLGLVVVDEEQRFGVAHKEKLKQLRREVDVLTLSATPIPRTLYMALSGIRDMSTIDTPPEARLPVKTFVSEYSDDVIKEAILRELERDGQAFFLHNRVKTIGQAAAHVAELVPQARILIGHGQMPESELEDVMVAFSNGEADVLVCTTIIESGLDLPNVNTLVVDRADHFGLSQLYQLRGRVGRGDHRAYAYLMVPRGRRITEAAEQRLEAILEASELGSGFRVAMRDLEIRGAGNLLGAAQSGQIHAVGLDLYSQLLQEAVREVATQRGNPPVVPPSQRGTEGGNLPRVQLPLPAQIPEEYIAHMPTRLAVYQQLARITERREVPELREELRDRFGPLPQEVENLLLLVDLRALAHAVGIESVVRSGDVIVVALREPVGGAKLPLQRALGPSVNVGNQQMTLATRQLGLQWLTRLTRVLERLQAFQERVRDLAPA